MSIRSWFAGTKAQEMTSDVTDNDRAWEDLFEWSRLRSEHRANRDQCLSCEAGIQAPHDIRWAT